MKKIILFLSILFLTGCEDKLEIEVIEEKISFDHIPQMVVLETKDNTEMGKGVYLKDNIFIAPDHLLENNESLFVKDQPIKILARYFKGDLLFFSGADVLYSSVWRMHPPAIGQKLFWFDGFEIHEVQVRNNNASFFWDELKIENLVSVEGDLLTPGDSGSPVFDHQGRVYGMFIATDKSKEESYFIRSDIILDILEELL